MMRYSVWISNLFLLCFFNLAHSQNIIYGTIKAYDQSVIDGAVFSVSHHNNIVSTTVSNEDGAYLLSFEEDFKNISLTVDYFDFEIYEEDFDFSNVNEIRRNIIVSIDKGLLQSPITISTEIDSSMSHNFSAISINQKAVTLAASFDDPSRALYKYPGIVNTNDQANGIVYRGLPSEFLNWSIFGAEILNPNHLSNAGRLNDARSSNAGGVLAIPYNAINQLVFYAMPNKGAQWSAISGVLDLDLNGPSKNYFRVGLLGTELALSDKQNRYQGIARYSTVGLLGDLGVDFDGESISYQDAFLRYQLNDHLLGFTLLGSSNNTKPQNPFPLTIEDLKDKSYQSKFIITGLKSDFGKFRNTIAFSLRSDHKNTTQEQLLDESYITIDNMDVKETQLSLRSEFDVFENQKLGTLSSGLLFNWYNNKTQFRILNSNQDLSYIELSPFLAYRKKHQLSYNAILEFNSSVLAHYDDFSNQLSIEPSIGAKWTKNFLSFFLDYGYKSQLKDPLFVQLNQNAFYFDRTRGRITSFGFEWKDHRNQIVLLRGYRYWLSDVSTQDLTLDRVLGFFVPEDVYFAEWDGIEMLYSKKYKNGIFFNLNSSLSFDYLDRREFVINTSLAKAFQWKNKVLSIMFSANRRFYNSRSERGEDYFSLNSRISYQFKSKNFLILEIQNVTNARNIAYSYFDSLSSRFIEENALGILPVLSYRRDF